MIFCRMISFEFPWWHLTILGRSLCDFSLFCRMQIFLFSKHLFTFITPKTAKNNVSIDCYLSLATNPLFRATKQITRDGGWRGMWDRAAVCLRDNINMSSWLCRSRVWQVRLFTYFCSAAVVVGVTSSETFDWGRVARHGSRPAPQTRWPI